MQLHSLATSIVKGLYKPYYKNQLFEQAENVEKKKKKGEREIKFNPLHSCVAFYILIISFT